MDQLVSLTGVQQIDTHPRMEEANVITTGRKLGTTIVHLSTARVVKALQ